MNDIQKKALAMWLTDLRSGAISQARGRLGVNNARCCLGVLCDVALRLQPDVVAVEKTDRDGVIYGGNGSTIPKAIVEMLGLASSVGLPASAADSGTLTNMNDNGKSFATIADVIERRASEIFISKEK